MKRYLNKFIISLMTGILFLGVISCGKKINVTFNPNGGSIGDKPLIVSIKKGSTLEGILPTATKEYYDFLGWDYLDSIYSPTVKISASTTLTATWKPTNYSITYNLNGGIAPSGDLINSPGYNIESGTIFLNNPTKDGFNFEGWYYESSFTGNPITSIISSNIISQGNITIYARWSLAVPGIYTITFDSNGGTPVASIDTNQSGIATKPTDPTKASDSYYSYSFGGWYTESGLVTPVNWQQPITTNKTYYAKWTSTPIIITINYTLTFVTNSKDSISPITEPAGSVINEVNNPTKTGYSFTGWYSNISLTESVSWPITLNSNLTIYGSWEKIIYTFSVNYNDEGQLEGYEANYTSDRPEIDYTEGTSLDLSSITPTREFYNFTGWYSNSSLTEEITTIPSSLTSNLTIYAGWSYTSPFYLIGSVNDITWDTEDFNLPKFDNLILYPVFSTVGGDHFYYKLASDLVVTVSGSGKVYGETGNTNKYAGIPYGIEGVAQDIDISFTLGDHVMIYADYYPGEGSGMYASIVVNKHTITFNTDGGSSVDPVVFIKDEAAIKPADPTKAGKLFVKWNYSGQDVEVSWDSTSHISMEVIAIWEDAYYQVTFNDNVENDTIEVNTSIVGISYLTPIADLDDFGSWTIGTRTGYNFVGWSLSSNGSIITGNEEISSDITLYATWNHIEYSISFNLDGGTPSQSSISYYIDDKTNLTSLPVVTKVGYTFIEYQVFFIDNTTSSHLELEEVVSSYSSINYGTYTLKAIWEANTYSISFVYNYPGGSEPTGDTITSVSLTYGSSLSTIPVSTGLAQQGLPKPVISGKLVEWYKDVELTSKVTGSTIFNWDGVTSGVTLYANWISGTISSIVYYDVDEISSDSPYSGSSLDGSNQYVETFTYILPTPTKLGYDFAGWYLNSDGSGTAITELDTSYRGTVTLYASWSSYVYNVETSSTGIQGGTWTVNGSVNYGDTLDITFNSHVNYKGSSVLTLKVTSIYDNGEPVPLIISYQGTPTTSEVIAKLVVPTNLVKGTKIKIELVSTLYLIYTATLDASSTLANSGVVYAGGDIKHIETESAISLSSYIPTSPIYEFLGWYDQDNEKVVSFLPGEVKANFTLKAHYGIKITGVNNSGDHGKITLAYGVDKTVISAYPYTVDLTKIGSAAVTFWVTVPQYKAATAITANGASTVVTYPERKNFSESNYIVCTDTTAKVTLNTFTDKEVTLSSEMNWSATLTITDGIMAGEFIYIRKNQDIKLGYLSDVLESYQQIVYKSIRYSSMDEAWNDGNDRNNTNSFGDDTVLIVLNQANMYTQAAEWALNGSFTFQSWTEPNWSDRVIVDMTSVALTTGDKQLYVCIKPAVQDRCRAVRGDVEGAVKEGTDWSGNISYWYNGGNGVWP